MSEYVLESLRGGVPASCSGVDERGRSFRGGGGHRGRPHPRSQFVITDTKSNGTGAVRPAANFGVNEGRCASEPAERWPSSPQVSRGTLRRDSHLISEAAAGAGEEHVCRHPHPDATGVYLGRVENGRQNQVGMRPSAIGGHGSHGRHPDPRTNLFASDAKPDAASPLGPSTDLSVDQSWRVPEAYPH